MQSGHTQNVRNGCKKCGEKLKKACNGWRQKISFSDGAISIRTSTASVTCHTETETETETDTETNTKTETEKERKVFLEKERNFFEFCLRHTCRCTARHPARLCATRERKRAAEGTRHKRECVQESMRTKKRVHTREGTRYNYSSKEINFGA